MRYPFISGHEVIGRITALSAQAKGSSIGQRVGIGWTTGSPVDIARVLDFAARHDIRPQVEMLAMAKINEA